MNEEKLQKIHDQARKEHIPIMLDDGLEFLKMFVKEHEGIRDILEVGTAVGHSAISMAEIRWDMTVDTLEIDPVMYEKAVGNIKEAGLEERVHVYLTDAAEFTTDRVYDLIFIDAAKAQYKRYLEHFYRNSRKGTFFVFDNLNFHGMVEGIEPTENRGTRQMLRKIGVFREKLFQDERFVTVFYHDTGDGIAVSERKE